MMNSIRTHIDTVYVQKKYAIALHSYIIDKNLKINTTEHYSVIKINTQIKLIQKFWSGNYVKKKCYRQYIKL